MGDFSWVTAVFFMEAKKINVGIYTLQAKLFFLLACYRVEERENLPNSVGRT